MKLKAFIQAFLVIVLLSFSWVLLLRRMETEAVPDQAPGESVQQDEISESQSPESDVVPETPEIHAPANPRDLVTDRWIEWWDYLDSRSSPQDLRAALASLRELVRELDPDLARDWILEFLRSGADMRTGLAFQIQGDGRLRGATSLRAYLLDLLQMVDPLLAGQLAEEELTHSGTSLAPDVYVIHLRNYAKNPSLSKDESLPFLRERFGDLIQNESWITTPTTALAEAMDVAVYTEAVQFVPELEALLGKNQPQLLRHASALALERLVDRAPMETLGAFLETLPQQNEINPARAGFFARLDPGLPGGSELLEDYLGSPGLQQEEAVRFLESFPNLNQSRSYNLVSTDNSDTPPIDYIERIRNAVDLMGKWQDDNTFPPLQETIANTRIRLQAQLTGDPVP